MESRRNNLDLIRFLCAVLVIFSHSYPLTNSSKEPLAVFTRQTSFGGIAVAVFFVVSGFLIPQSFDRSDNVINYFKARILRIFPGLLICFCFAAFIIGPIFTSLPLSDYFTNGQTYKYFVGFTLLPNVSPSLPSVFTDNPFGSFVNGSLWTLKFEFFFYIVVAFIGRFKMLNKKYVVFFFTLFLALSLLKINEDIHNLFMLGSYFFGGTLLYIFREQIVLKHYYAIASFALILLASQLGFMNATIAVFGSYLVIYMGFQRKLFFPNFAKYGDFSYGIYIYAFPIQQAIVAALGKTISPFENFIISLPIVIVLSFFSWHLVEKRALRLKNYSFRKNTGRNKTA